MCMRKYMNSLTVSELCEFFCADIGSIKTNKVLFGVLFSHCKFWKKNLSESEIENQVEKWVSNQV